MQRKRAENGQSLYLSVATMKTGYIFSSLFDSISVPAHTSGRNSEVKYHAEIAINFSVHPMKNFENPRIITGKRLTDHGVHGLKS